MRNVWLLICCSVVLAGCGTTAVPIGKAKLAPPERVLAYQEKTAGETGVLVVTRDEGYMGSGCYNSFHINGVLSARMGVAGMARFYVPAGELVLRVAPDPQGAGLCGLGQEYWTQRETIIRPGEVKNFRLLLDASGKPDVQRLD